MKKLIIICILFIFTIAYADNNSTQWIIPIKNVKEISFSNGDKALQIDIQPMIEYLPSQINNDPNYTFEKLILDIRYAFLKCKNLMTKECLKKTSSAFKDPFQIDYQNKIIKIKQKNTVSTYYFDNLQKFQPEFDQVQKTSASIIEMKNKSNEILRCYNLIGTFSYINNTNKQPLMVIKFNDSLTKCFNYINLNKLIIEAQSERELNSNGSAVSWAENGIAIYDAAEKFLYVKKYSQENTGTVSQDGWWKSDFESDLKRFQLIASKNEFPLSLGEYNNGNIIISKVNNNMIYACSIKNESVRGSCNYPDTKFIKISPNIYTASIYAQDKMKPIGAFILIKTGLNKFILNISGGTEYCGAGISLDSIYKVTKVTQNPTCDIE